MKYQFKQAVRIDGQTLLTGSREVSAEIEAHPDFHHFVKCGWIAEVEETKAPVPQETFSERAERLHKKLSEKYKIAPPPVQDLEPKEELLEPHEFEDESAAAEESLTPQQKAARTRKAKAEAKKAEKGE